MSVPDWWATLLLSLAAWRPWWLLSQDTILVRPRQRVMEGRPHVEQFIDCPYCSGFWLALAWFAAWQAWPHGSLVAASFAAIAAVVAIVGSLLSDGSG